MFVAGAISFLIHLANSDLRLVRCSIASTFVQLHWLLSWNFQPRDTSYSYLSTGWVLYPIPAPGCTMTKNAFIKHSWHRVRELGFKVRPSLEELRVCFWLHSKIIVLCLSGCMISMVSSRMCGAALPADQQNKTNPSLQVHPKGIWKPCRWGMGSVPGIPHVCSGLSVAITLGTGSF